MRKDSIRVDPINMEQLVIYNNYNRVGIHWSLNPSVYLIKVFSGVEGYKVSIALTDYHITNVY